MEIGFSLDSLVSGSLPLFQALCHTNMHTHTHTLSNIQQVAENK